MAERRMFDDILNAFKRGDIDEAEAGVRILEMFYEGRERFLLDMEREQRLGFPEIIYGEGKQTGDLLQVVAHMMESKGRAFVANLTPDGEQVLNEHFHGQQIKSCGRLMVIGTAPPTEPLGTVGIITAGTSDVPYADECALLLEELGVTVLKAHDCGVAGIHRPLMSLQRMGGAQAFIAFAGMEGALPTVLASLTDLPVIAVPTPVGYGFGSQGNAALATMLQSCSPGVTVVNIGNSVGAAAAAIRILRSARKTKT